MSISHSLANALSGLTAASRMAEVVSSNLANSMTDGYGKRRLDLSAQTVGGRGAGVQIDGITRLVDRGILSDRRLADASRMGYDAKASMLGRLERTLGGADGSGDIAARIAQLETALATAGSDPSSDVRLTAVGDRLQALAQGLNDGSDAVQSLRMEADADIAAQVKQLNTALKQVERLNADITYSRNTGQDPSALMDARQRAVDTIAGLVPIRELDRQGGQIALMTPSGQMLIDGPAPEFGFQATHTITPDMTLQSGALSGLTLNGQPLDPGTGVGRLAGGTLGAAFGLRDGSLVAAQDGLDIIAQDLMDRFSDPLADPTVLPGGSGLFVDPAALGDRVGLAGRLVVNPTVDPDQGGALFRLRDGVGAATPGPQGDAQQIDRWLAALSAPRAPASGGAAASAAGLAARASSDVGSARVAAEDQLIFATARWDTLRQSELAGGVDTDQELQVLLRVEQSYAANAKLVQTVEQMIQTLMEL